MRCGSRARRPRHARSASSRSTAGRLSRAARWLRPESCALWNCAWMSAASDCCCSSSFFSRTLRLARSASAARSWNSASSAPAARSRRCSSRIPCRAQTTVLGQRDDPFDAASVLGSDPADVFGDQRAGAANLAEHRAALDGVGPHRAELHGRRRRFQLRETDGDEHEHEQAGDGENRAPDALLSCDGRAWNIHDLLCVRAANPAARMMTKVKPCASRSQAPTAWT